ncbi:hypothetical protein LEP1GSC072_2671 [Leptospira noguchii str. Bonito]|nr:hypothetical protein LEP1GSC072_2671 [Leptospira noguchii str. Bonito]
MIECLNLTFIVGFRKNRKSFGRLGQPIFSRKNFSKLAKNGINPKLNV